MHEIGVRWTIGDVSRNGFEALGLSIWGAYKVFGPRARYAVCVNTLAIGEVRRRVGLVPARVEWVNAEHELPPWIRAYLAPNFAEGVAWKFAPLRYFCDRKELSLDNDCILWEMPGAVARWLDDDDGAVLVAEDVRPCYGQFDDLCGAASRNLGMRGLSPSFDLESALRNVLSKHPVVLSSELDEQGLQLAALLQAARLHVVSLEDVAICSPFPPHRPSLGRSGAHFCGLNAKRISFLCANRPAEVVVDEFWRGHTSSIRAYIGVGANTR